MIREEVSRASMPRTRFTILATGPLTSPALNGEIQRLTGSEHLAFYDSISPIVDADSIDMNRVYFAARWDKGTADYINCPMSREEYDCFLDALLAAEAAEAKEWEKLEYFEGCLPIEILARRGRDTLRFGPMKPVGLRDPRTGKTPWAVVQLRKRICAPTATTSWAFKTTSSGANRRACCGSSPDSRMRGSCVMARSTATLISALPLCWTKPSVSN